MWLVKSASQDGSLVNVGHQYLPAGWWVFSVSRKSKIICMDEVVEIFWASSRAALLWYIAKGESDMGAGSTHLPF